MARPYQVMQRPIFTPYVCIQCGVGEGRREWFVDLGLPIDQYFNMDNHAIYLCNECYNGMTLDIGRLIVQFRHDHEKWEGGETITYTLFKESQDDVRESESGEQNSGVGEDQLVDATTTSSSDRDDQDTEPNDSEPEPTDSGDAESVDDSDSDESTNLSVKFGSS